MQLSPRILEAIDVDFPAAQRAHVIDLLANVEPPLHREPHERLCGAILLLAHGDIDELLEAVALAEVDWRDLLVHAGLAHDDWPEKLRAGLATVRDQPTQPIATSGIPPAH